MRPLLLLRSFSLSRPHSFLPSLPPAVFLAGLAHTLTTAASPARALSSHSPSPLARLSSRSASTGNTNRRHSNALRSSSDRTLKRYFAMATNTNKACCTIPPVQHDYTPKGNYEEVAGLKTYVHGPADAKKAIVFVYDIFGFFPQTLQGADIVAETLKARVYMPDFFRGKPFPIENFPPNTPEKQRALQKFFGDAGNFQARKPEVDAVASEVRKRGAEKVGLVGFCWGAKLTVQVGGQSPCAVDAVAQVHPAMLDHNDAKKLQVPIASFPSKDEPKDEFAKFEAEVKKLPIASKSVSKVYDNVWHGFAAARADLKNEECVAAYKDVYQRLVDFFEKAL